MPTNKRLRAAAGFTLLELLVVLVIAGMLVAVVPPLVSAAVPGAKARAAALDLTATLRDARYLAISQSRTVDVEFDLDAPAYHIAGMPATKLPRGMTLAILHRSGYVSAMRHVAGHLDDTNAAYTLRFQADGSSNGVQARLGPADGGYIVTVDWLMGGASISEASSDEH